MLEPTLSWLTANSDEQWAAQALSEGELRSVDPPSVGTNSRSLFTHTLRIFAMWASLAPLLTLPVLLASKQPDTSHARLISRLSGRKFCFPRKPSLVRTLVLKHCT